jgi:hypothetical protein
MTDSVRAMGKSNFIREVLAAWIVTLSAGAIGLLLLALHESRTDDRTVPLWYERPIADTEEWDEDLSAPRDAGWVLPQSGSSTAPDTQPPNTLLNER